MAVAAAVAAAAGASRWGAAVTSCAAAAALGGGEQLAPSARALLSLGPISRCHFSPSSPAGLARLQGAEVAAVTAPAGGCSRAGWRAGDALQSAVPAAHSSCPS